MENVREISDASLRAADLCRQMLAYAGGGTLAGEHVDLNLKVRDVVRLLRGSLSSKARLDYDLADSPPVVWGDPSQLQQVIMNLLTNASEALGGREGQIVIATGAVECDRSALIAYGAHDLPEGTYATLEVTDSGCGMAPEVADRVFDPFFTTKSTGHGLGLAAVLGIVRAHHGSISVNSRPGQGTTFRALFAVAEPSGAPFETEGEEEPGPWRGTGTLLLVDDEASVRAVGRRMVEKVGFSVLTAANGVEAVDVFQRHPDEIVGVLLDLRMPEMSGIECFRELRRQRPDLRVLVCTGHGEEEAIDSFSGEKHVGFLLKPYRLAELHDRLRTTLG